MMTLTGLTFASAAITSLLNERPETQLMFCAHEIRHSPGSVFCYCQLQMDTFIRINCGLDDCCFAVLLDLSRKCLDQWQ